MAKIPGKMGYLSRMQAAAIHLIPVPLSGAGIDQLSREAIEAAHALDFFVAERAKSARSFLRAARHPLPASEVEVVQMPREDLRSFFRDLLPAVQRGRGLGVLSEAGVPCVADPGAELVALAHQHNIEVRPYPGPNSLILALMASGMNAQAFTFHGYLPSKKDPLRQKLAQLAAEWKKNRIPQAFMETPYRNHQVFDAIRNHVAGTTALCVASQLGNPDQLIRRRLVSEWTDADCAKHFDMPSIFILGE